MQINHGPSLATLSFGQLAEIVGGVLGGSATAASPLSVGPGRITIHSTRVETGSIFFALQGKRDGHEWVQDALEHGAHCAIVKLDAAAYQSSGPVLGVSDPLDALQKLATWYRQQLSCDVIAVAGSLGKTTTKEALVSFLSESEFCYAVRAATTARLASRCRFLDVRAMLNAP